MTRGCAAALVALLAAAPAGAQAPAAPASTLDRPEAGVVLAGAKLKPLHGAAIDALRLARVGAAGLEPVPFQVDERAPDGGLCFDGGDERRSDADDRHLDSNDELVLRASDAGPRLAPGAATKLGGLTPAQTVELELVDPRGGGRGWLYLLRFDGLVPDGSAEDRIVLDWRGRDLLGWRGDRAHVVAGPSGTNALDLRELRFVAGKGKEPGPDVLDRAKLALRARYLFLDVQRRLDEVRARPVAWRDGPVRATARLVGETYLIWGHWVKLGPRSLLTLWGDRVELLLEAQLPVALEADAPSELDLALDFSPAAGGVAAWTDRNGKAIRGGSSRARDLKGVDAARPEWVCVTAPSGSILARLTLGPGLARASHRLLLVDSPVADAPEDAPGSLCQVGWRLDLTGLAAGSYELKLVLQLGPPLEPGQEAKLLAADDAPLQVEVR